MIWGSQHHPGEPDSFYWQLIRKYVVVFGQMFADISIQRNLANNTTQNIVVPLQYAAKEKMLAALEGDPNLDRPFSVNLPTMSFEIEKPGIVYDGERNVPNLQKNIIYNPDNKNTLKIQYSGAPYNIFFNLYVYVKNAEDGCKIIEQIIPFFKPEYTPTVQLIPEMNVDLDIPIILTGVQYEDLYDGKLQDRRVLMYILSFKMKAWFFGPIRKKPVIKFTTVNSRFGVEANAIDAAYSGYVNLSAAVNSSSNNISLIANGIALGIPKTAPYYGRIDQEVVQVVNGAGSNSLTIVRGALGTTANAHSAGATFYSVYEPTVAEYVTTTPGLTNTGLPTTNSSLSVPYSNVSIFDDYGFITSIKDPVSNT